MGGVHVPPELVARTIERTENDHTDLPGLVAEEMLRNIAMHLQNSQSFAQHLLVIVALD
jgi:hypothetical protein